MTSASIDLQDYTYYFVAAPWLSVKLLRLLQCYPPPGIAQYISVSGVRLDIHLLILYRKIHYMFSSSASLKFNKKKRLFIIMGHTVISQTKQKRFSICRVYLVIYSSY